MKSFKERQAKIRQPITPYLFLLPALIALGLTVFYPAIQAFALSFTRFEFDVTQPPQWIGFENFKRLWGDRVFWQTLRNTLLYLVGVVPLLVVVPLGLAILVNRKIRGINWFRLSFYTPVVISMVVAGIAWRALYDSNGIFNQLLELAGISEGIRWLTSPELALWSIMVVTIWKGLGYYMVIYLAGLQSIPAELYEAASLDGSDGWIEHWDITVPLMRPYLLLVTVISSISATKVFEEVFVMTRGGPLNSSKTVVYYVYDQAFSAQYLDYSYGCTIGLVLFLFILILSILNLKLSRNSVSGQNLQIY
jgi:putative chitobiose transport system permease protein